MVEDLERRQNPIFRQIAALELLLLPHRLYSLSLHLRAGGAGIFLFKRVAPDYNDWPLERRPGALGAVSVHHLCTSIVMYIARLNAENVKNFLYALNNGKIHKKRFNMRLAPEEESAKLTGYEHNAVTCVGLKTEIPVILDEAFTKLHPNFIWLGGGEVDLKLGIGTLEFINFVKPFVSTAVVID